MYRGKEVTREKSIKEINIMIDACIQNTVVL